MLKLNWENCIQPERLKLVFEEKNQKYGAYILRSSYTNSLIKAFVISLSALLLLIAVPYIQSFLSSAKDKLENLSETEITLMQPPPIDENAPPPPDIPPPPPVQQTIKFTPPVVVKDDEVAQDEPLASQEELKDVAAGTTTQAGDPNALNLPDDEPSEGTAAPEIFTIVEEMPSFPGGESALVKYLSDNIKYPARARENNITGTVFVTFVIGKDGKVSESKILRGIGAGCDEEALRVINTMPAWRVGKQRGVPVMVQYNLPIRFSLK